VDARDRRGHDESNFVTPISADQPAADRRDIILFDGVCVLCSRWCRFVSARDRAQRFRFVAMQSPEGRALAARFGIDPDHPDTFALIRGDDAYLRSDAALRILRELPRWRWSVVLRAIPGPLRDALYGVIARNRYRWFGRLDACALPKMP
jgi:predicted DCC family thiol-disulfide oxidoreductase YuxK